MTTKSKCLSALSAAFCLAATYFIILQPHAGLGAYIAGLIPAVMVAFTALVRGNAIPAEVTSWRSHIRRAGFFFTGIFAVSFIARPLTGEWPSYYSLLALIGITCNWLTTPNMPPWWDIITGAKKIRLKDIL